jgi:hypothetical protein
MISPVQFPLWNQRDPKWAGQRLGTKDGTTIGGYGCLLTCIAMMNRGFDPLSPILWPNNVDDLFTNQNGYANGNLVIWTAIRRILPNVALLDHDNCATVPAPIDKIRDLLNRGGACVLRVGFGGNSANMHWLLANGYDGNDIIFHDPWYGDESRFASHRYGAGVAATDILEVYYFGDAIADPPVYKPEAPIAKLPAENPIPLPTSEPVVVPVAEPVDEPLPTPAPEPQIEKEPEPTPEWVGTWRVQPEKERSVVNPIGAKVIDMETTVVIATLPAGYAVKDIAGFFTFQNTEWARTKWAVDNNKWTAVRATDLSSPTLEIPVVKKDIDNIFTDISPQALESSFVDLATEIKQNSSNLAALRIHLSAVLAILLSPVLRKLGRKQ